MSDSSPATQRTFADWWDTFGRAREVDLPIRDKFHVAKMAWEAALSETTRWIPVSERLPEVALGDEELLWVCALRKHNGKKYVFALHWVNRPHTEGDDSEHDWEICNEDGDPMNCVGWHKVGCNSNYDEFFMAVEEPEEIIAWMPMTKPEAA